jgi:hypothetical protein
MPLIDLKTNLKSIKYGSDQPGGGWSGQPFIQFPIEDAGTPKSILDFYSNNRSNPDYPIRGGGLKFGIGTQTFTVSSQIDKSRIKKFFESKPRGNAFLKKQIGLNLSNPKIETGNSFQVVPGSNLIPGLLENTRIYNNGINTLTQIGLQGTGTHLPRAGVFPIDLASKYYKDIVGAQNINNESKTNRLLILRNLKLNTRASSVVIDPNMVNKLGISFNRDILFQYLGGPGSSYGIGATTIRRSKDSDTSKAASKPNTTELIVTVPELENSILVISNLSMTYDTIFNQNLNTTVKGVRSKNIQDYRKADSSNEIKKIASREQIYNLTIRGQADTLSKLKSFKFDNENAPWELTNGKDTKDIIKFVFEAISNDNPRDSWAIFFRAMLSGFTDNHQASINAFKYQGRGEDLYTYQGVSRAIAFSFKIGVQSRTELKPLYSKLNHLISQVYPDYSPKYNIMRAPIIRLTIGDYLYRVAGMLENVSITVDDNSPWEINYENSPDIKQLPQVINIQCSFKPIQDFVPRRINDDNQNVPFMTNSAEDYLSIAGYETVNKIPTSVEKDNTVVSDNITDKIAQARNRTFKYNPPKPINPFESILEKQIRTGKKA